MTASSGTFNFPSAPSSGTRVSKPTGPIGKLEPTIPFHKLKLAKKTDASRNSALNEPGDKLLSGPLRSSPGLGSAQDARFRKRYTVVNEHKEAFMTKVDGKQNHAAMLNEQLPEALERSIRECLVVNPVKF